VSGAETKPRSRALLDAGSLSDDDGSYSWDISSYSSQFGIGLRCKATDSETNSSWYPGATGGSDIGVDNDGPWWTNPTINETPPIDNLMWLDFNATWTEYNQTELSTYIFANNQSGGWTNSSVIVFTNGINYSNYTMQISTTQESVSWYIWANDTVGNENQTDIQSFAVLANTPPEAQNVNITPDDNWKNQTNANLTGVFTYYDFDSDPIQANETMWYKDTFEETALKNYTLVDYTETTKGDVWIFSARVYDGTDWSSWINSSEFTILNTPPSAPTSLTPTAGLWG